MSDQISKVVKAFNDYYSAYCNRDMEKLKAMFTDSFSGFGSGADEFWAGIEEGLRLYRRDIEQAPERMDYELEILEIRKIAHSRYLLNADVTLYPNLLDREEKISSLRQTMVFVEQDGRYLADFKHISLPWVIQQEGESYPLEELRRQNEILEHEVEERTKELKHSIEEIEMFAYAVSHDLKAPLRHITGYLDLLGDSAGDAMDEVGRKSLSKINDAVEKMSAMIDGLLKLSNVTMSELDYSQVDLSLVAKDIAGRLTAYEPDRAVEFVIDNDIKVEADKSLMIVLVQNLIENAWKFTSTKSKTRIEFGIQKQEDKEVIYIKDNGVGFDPKKAEDLFSPFKRLHSSEYQGFGIGLATVNKIIDRHGGKIWFDAKQDHGASFYFTL